MSAPARTVIQRLSGEQRVGSGIVFELSASQAADSSELIAALGNQRPSNKKSAEVRLRKLIQSHAKTLNLPAAAVIHDRVCPDDVPCQDLLSTLTVMAKSSGSVYLRDKEPNLNHIKPGRRIVVVVPLHWKSKS
jgi:hypothetical protein